MITYWDSSALVEALHNQTLRDKIRPHAAVTRPHSLAEVFSTLTKGVNFRYTAEDAAKMLADLKTDLDFVELTAEDAMTTINEASDHGVRGARIHDLMHAAAAVKSGAKILLTLDTAGFSDLRHAIKVQAP
jgi:predicted nucleic acid-binding protein